MSQIFFEYIFFSVRWLKNHSVKLSLNANKSWHGTLVFFSQSSCHNQTRKSPGRWAYRERVSWGELRMILTCKVWFCPVGVVYKEISTATGSSKRHICHIFNHRDTHLRRVIKYSVIHTSSLAWFLQTIFVNYEIEKFENKNSHQI